MLELPHHDYLQLTYPKSVTQDSGLLEGPEIQDPGTISQVGHGTRDPGLRKWISKMFYRFSLKPSDYN